VQIKYGNSHKSKEIVTMEDSKEGEKKRKREVPLSKWKEIPDV
jgi:hypothetical protein